MRKANQKIASLFLSLALVITSMNAMPQSIAVSDVKAEELSVDLTDVTVDKDIVNGGDASVISALGSDSMTIDGVSYKNYMQYEGVTASASSERESASKAIDGNTGSRWESEQGVDPQYLTIDLGNVYSIKDIAIYWEGASAKEYTVEVSADGNNFQTLTQVTDTHGKRTDNLKLSREIQVRTIRIYCTARTTIYGDSIYEIGFFGNDPQGEVVPILSNLKVRDYYKYTGKYMIYFNEAAESAGYNVYIDNTENKVKTVNGSGYYLSEEEISGLSEGQHTLYVANTDATGKESAMISANFTVEGTAGVNTDVPQIYIYTEKSISSEYHENADVTVTVIDRDDGENKDLIDSGSNIKIRGNTTAAAPKKPWNIKLSSKQKLLGMEKGKKWCLLANSFDKSLMRNNLVYDFAEEIGVQYNCDNRFVEVYINGKFNGNYLITEAVEAKKERVNIDAYNAESNDILLELGTRNEPDVDHFTTNTLGTTFDVNDPEKGDDLTDAQVDEKIKNVKSYLDNFETVLKNQNYDEILNYMDEDTFVNFYIVNELFKNVDFNFSSTRFYIKDNKVYAGPCWDYDLSSGNCKSSYYTDYYVDGVSYKGYYCQGMNWYKQLFKNEAFYNKVKDRYKELQYSIQNIYKNDSETKISIKNLVENYGASFERNYMSTEELGAGWLLTNDDGYSYAAESGWTTWQQPIEFLRSWLENRNAWLCSEWGIDMEQAYEESKPQQEPETTTPEVTTPAETDPVATTPAETNPTETDPVATDPVATTPTETDPAETDPVATDPVATDPVATTDPSKTTADSQETTKEQSTVVQSVSRTDDGMDESYKKVAKGKVKKATKKKNAKKIKLTFKKLKNITRYQVKISSTKSFKKKKTIVKLVKKTKVSLTIKKLKKAKKLYVKVRGVKIVDGKRVYGDWSRRKKVKIK